MSSEPSSVTNASTSKAATVTNDTSTSVSVPPVTEGSDIDDQSLEEAALKGGDDDDYDNNSEAAAAGDASIGIFDDDIPDFTPPLRITSLRGTSEQPRLTGSQSQLQGLPSVALHHHQRQPHSSRSGSRSGSESPSQGSRGSGGGRRKHFDAGSSISSLEDAGIDIDILTDKMGVLELDLKTQQDNCHNLNKSLSNLTAVNERLSDETLEDVHAFSDVKGREQTGTLSRGGSITTGGEVSSNVLEPLEEIEEQDDDSAEGAVKITNLAEILEAPDED